MNLATLLERHRSDIASAWATRLRALPGSRYRDWSFDEVVAWACGALDAIIGSLRSESPHVLEAHATAISERRAEQSFEIDQVIEGLLLLHEATLPYIFDGHSEVADDAVDAARDLYASLRRMAAHFATLFARSMKEQQEHLAVLEERNRLARDLHDSVSQSLYGVGMYAEAAARLLENGNTQAASEHLREVRDSASEALREMRFLIFELRPSILREEGLIPALKARLSAVESRAGVHTELAADDGDRLPYEVEEALYGIAREALNNGLRHGRATRVQIRLTRSAAGTVLDISDDGIGFDVETASQKGGLGLGGMRERAARIDASLSLVSRPGHGTRVDVVVPPRPDAPSHGHGNERAE
jgi:signal transduction histidine kinase